MMVYMISCNALKASIHILCHMRGSAKSNDRRAKVAGVVRRRVGGLRPRWESKKLGETGEGTSRLFFVMGEEVSRHIADLSTIKPEVNSGIEYHPPGEIKD